MAFTADEQELYDFGVGAVPKFLFAEERAEEVVGAYVKMFDAARSAIATLFSQTYILNATGSGPAYLDQHAKDRGTSRQGTETDAELRARIRNVPDLVTMGILIDAANAIVVAAGVDDVPVEFVADSNLNITDNDITKNAGGSGWNAGAISQERIMVGENGYVEFKVSQTDGDCICGLNYNGSGAVTQADIDFGLQPSDAGLIEIYEGGVQRGTTYGSYTAADSFRVSVDDDVVTYWHKPAAGDWTLLYTSEGVPTYPLRADTSIYSQGDSITDVVITQSVRIVELRRDKAYLGAHVKDDDTGGVFSGTAPSMKFEPTAGWARPPFVEDWPPFGYKIKFANSDSAGNDGTFLVTGLDGDKVEYTNASGVAESDSNTEWEALKLDQDGNTVDASATTFGRQAFLSRGYRMGHGMPNTIIMILPYGATADTVLAVQEMLRQKKAAGILAYVERRTSV